MELGPLQKQWLHNLRTYPERKGKLQLGEGNPDNYKACCLGELLLICEKGEFVNNVLVEKNNHKSDKYPYQSYQELGLSNNAGSPFDDEGDALSLMNDDGKSWPEIADIVEANPERYFNKSY